MTSGPRIVGKYAAPDGVIINGQPLQRTRRDNQGLFENMIYAEAKEKRLDLFHLTTAAEAEMLAANLVAAGREVEAVWEELLPHTDVIGWIVAVKPRKREVVPLGFE